MPLTILDLPGVLVAAHTFREAVKTFQRHALERIITCGSGKWAPEHTLPVWEAADSLRKTLTPSDIDFNTSMANADINHSFLSSNIKILLDKVWRQVTGVRKGGTTLPPFDPNFHADQWDVLLDEVSAVLRPPEIGVAPLGALLKPPPRITTNLDTNSVILDGKPFRVTDRIAFKYFAALVAAHNEGRTPINRHDLVCASGLKPGKDPRPKKRLKKYLPDQLFNLITTAVVPGGGYSLELPPLKN